MYVEKLVENLIAKEIFCLVDQSLSGILPDMNEIEKALASAELDIKKIKVL